MGGWGHLSKMKKKKRKFNLKKKMVGILREGITDETNIILIEYLFCFFFRIFLFFVSKILVASGGVFSF